MFLASYDRISHELQRKCLLGLVLPETGCRNLPWRGTSVGYMFDYVRGKHQRDSSVSPVELKDLVDYVSIQLNEASKGADGRGGPVMKFNECTLTMTVTITKEVNAGIKVYVVTLGGDVSRSDTHTITVNFNSLPGHDVVAVVDDEVNDADLGKLEIEDE
jgi:hypothetical protein